MSDGVKPLSAVLATLAVGGGNAGAVATATAATSSLPPALAKLLLGNVLAGIVVERGRGAVLLKTDKGLIQLATNLPLKIGASVMLEVQSVGAQLRFAIVSVDQRAPQAPAAEIAAETRNPAATASSSRGDGGAPAATATNARMPLIGRVVTAEIVASPQAAPITGDAAIPTLLRRVAALTASLGTIPADPRVASASPPVPLPAAETLETIIAAIEQLPSEAVEALLRAQAPSPPTRAADAAPLPSASANGGPDSLPVPSADAASMPASNAAAPAARAESAEASAAHGGNAEVRAGAAPPKLIAIRVLDIAPPNAGGARAGSIPAPGTGDSITLVGTVASAGPAGVELTTPLGALRVPIAAGMPVGSQIAFEVVAQPRAAAAGPSPDMAPTAPPQRTLAADPPKDDWPALRDVAAALAQDGDALPIPKPGAPLGPALLAFLVGLRSGGGGKAWLGAAAVESLESSGKTRLIERLGDELAAQSRAASVADRNGWQTVAVPVLDGGRFNEIRVHVHQRRRDGKDNDEPGGRFIVEATLSALGPLQLDGLVRASRFDLIVRTARPLPDPVRRDIETLFAQSLSDTAYRGGVSFRGDAESRMDTRAHAAHSAGVIV